VSVFFLPLVCIAIFMVFVVRITVLGLPQDAAHTASTKTPKSLVLRARTVFSPFLSYNFSLISFW
jgi:hypothetical protein